MFLSKGKILLVSPVFYGYEKEISKELVRQGLMVSEFFFIGFSRKRICNKIAEKKFYENLINKFKEYASHGEFNYLLVINTDFINAGLMDFYLKENPRSKTILYLWDSIANLTWDNIFETLRLYDYKYSFDRVDVKNNPMLGLKHRPNFYHPYVDNLKPEKNPHFWISSIMSSQPDRIKFVNRFLRIYPQMPVYFKFHMASFMSFPAYLINHSVLILPKYICIKRLPIEKSLQYLNNSFSILDIPARNQKGLPFRSLDSIGLNKKLITTNSDIEYYDFYTPNNIMIINSDNIFELEEFFTKPFIPYNYQIRNKYSIEGWIKDILELE